MCKYCYSTNDLLNNSRSFSVISKTQTMRGIIMLNEHSEKTSQGIKTQTRRIVPQKVIAKCKNDLGLILNESTYKVGDVLYIKEPYWLHVNFDSFTPTQAYFNGADMVYFQECENAGTLRNARYMPECFSRQKIGITRVRVEYLNEISENDCKAEGIEIYDSFVNEYTKENIPYYQLHKPKNEKKSNADYFMGYVAYCKHEIYDTCMTHDIKTAYQTLFDSINGKGTYAKNPLVYVYEYRRYD